jgi:hypothetical protein
LLALPAVAVALGLAACGGSAGSGASAANADSKAETARIRLQQCLRENGLDVPDNPGTGGTRLRIDATKARAAMQKCRKYQQAAFGTITPQQRQEFRDAFTKFSACMRQHGVDVPEPGSGPRTAPPGGGGPRFDRASPTAQAALKACQDKLPKGGRGGGLRFAAPAAGSG